MISIGAPIVQGRSILRWNPRTGWSGTTSFRGLGPFISGKVAEFQSQNLPFTLTINDQLPYHQIEGEPGQAIDGSNPTNQVVETWDLDTNSIEKELIECDRAVALGEKVIAQVLKAANDALDPNGQDFDGHMGLLPPGDAQELFKRLVRGTPKSWLLAEWVLRRNKVAPPGVQFTEAYANKGKVYANTAAMVAAEKIVENNLPFPIPAGMWLKMPPKSGTREDGKGYMTQEFWHGDVIDDFLYPRII